MPSWLCHVYGFCAAVLGSLQFLHSPSPPFIMPFTRIPSIIFDIHCTPHIPTRACSTSTWNRAWFGEFSFFVTNLWSSYQDVKNTSQFAKPHPAFYIAAEYSKFTHTSTNDSIVLYYHTSYSVRWHKLPGSNDLIHVIHACLIYALTFRNVTTAIPPAQTHIISSSNCRKGTTSWPGR